jgi:esterase/lipase superfamily enzyme
MNVEYHHWDSPRLGQKFEMKQFGHAGVPMVAFPSSDGHFWDYADHGMIESVRKWVDLGKLQVFCVDGRDWEAWSNASIGSWDRANRADVWDSAIAEEVFPIVQEKSTAGERNVIVTGCSGGGFHAANFLFRHPELCNTAICLSGVYSTKHFRTDHVDDYDYSYPGVYYNNPLHYMKHLSDEKLLKKLRDTRIILCCGRGAYEEECLAETYALSAILNDKRINHWLDIWGHDVNHDWPWWRIQLAHFLGKLEL